MSSDSFAATAPLGSFAQSAVPLSCRPASVAIGWHQLAHQFAVQGARIGNECCTGVCALSPD